MSTASAIVESKQAVVFDLYHTLVSLEVSAPGRTPTHELLGVSREAWYRQLFVDTRARLLGHLRDPADIVADVAHRIDPTIPMERIREAADARAERFVVGLANIDPQTQRVLRALKGLGKKLGLVSNADCMEAAGWEGSPIAGLFDAAVFSCEAGSLKPGRAIYDLCLERLGVAPGAAVFVGDGGSHELEGARAAGLATVMITGHIRAIWPDEIPKRRPHADCVIEHLDELLPTTPN
jgi:putative hydrolase of the HAD superfamily